METKLETGITEEQSPPFPPPTMTIRPLRRVIKVSKRFLYSHKRTSTLTSPYHPFSSCSFLPVEFTKDSPGMKLDGGRAADTISNGKFLFTFSCPVK